MARKDPINKTSLPNGKEEIDTVVRRNGMAGSPGKPLERQRETSVNGNLQIAFKDIRTRPIIRMVFSELCPNCARQLERDNLSRKDAQVVNRVAKLLLDMIKKTNQVSVNLEDFTRQKWTLHVGNLYTEYSKVSYEVFKDDINWGRVSIFLGFSVSFAIYVDQQNIPGSANSVLEWACQVVEEDLGRFFLSNQGWEGFTNYLETATQPARISKLKTLTQSSPSAQPEQPEQNSSFLQGAVLAGALAIGAATAFTLKQAFS